jgi:hypothetical protein
MSPKRLNLADLGAGMPGLTPASGAVMAESAAVCLEDRFHRSGVVLRFLGIHSGERELVWPSVDEQQRRTYRDMHEATERGAYGLAILTMKEVTGLVVLERSRKGPGFDYWLGEVDDDKLFSNKVRLEVSGILNGSSADIAARARQKLNQIRPSDHLAPGFVVIVEFSQPISHVEARR